MAGKKAEVRVPGEYFDALNEVIFESVLNINDFRTATLRHTISEIDDVETGERKSFETYVLGLSQKVKGKDGKPDMLSQIRLRLPPKEFVKFVDLLTSAAASASVVEFDE